jgi:hypothetical protein
VPGNFFYIFWSSDFFLSISQATTYDRDDMCGFEYMSDSCGRWSKGAPLKYVSDRPDQNFQILVHPVLWGSSHIGFHDIALSCVSHKADVMHDYLVKHNNVFTAQIKRL